MVFAQFVHVSVGERAPEGVMSRDARAAPNRNEPSSALWGVPVLSALKASKGVQRHPDELGGCRGALEAEQRTEQREEEAERGGCRGN